MTCNINFGLDNNGTKSSNTPMPINSKSGNISLTLIPTSNNHSIAPIVLPWVNTEENGMLTKIAPNPIGNNRVGSSCLELLDISK